MNAPHCHRAAETQVTNWQVVWLLCCRSGMKRLEIADAALSDGVFTPSTHGG
jgi:hypothetical protein